VAALRGADRQALALAYVWYVPLLANQARKLGVARDECDELAATVLADVLLHLMQADLPPRDFVRYLVSALRNRARNEHRNRRRLLANREHAYLHHGDGRERIVAECHSEYALRASLGEAGADRDPADTAEDAGPFRSVIATLAAQSAQALTDVEAALMVGIGHHVPLRELAEQAGISHGAARVRAHRVREKMHKLMLQYAAMLSDDERRELRRFFRRAEIVLGTEAAAPVRRRPSRRDDATGEGSDDTR